MARLLEVDYENEVLLLERLMPGTALAELVPEQDERATSILVETMRKIWQPVPVQHSFATIEGYGRGFARLHVRYGEDCGPFPRRLVEEAERLFVELNAAEEQHLLLHGDLHHENVLLSGNEWRAIDAKGVVGDPGYEIGLLFYNPIPLIKRVPNPRKLLARRVDQLAEELGMERERIRGWGLAQCMLSCWWHVEDGYGQPPQEELACAEIMAGL
ncbi:MAG TPA: aminoglycoside phosphotransferase family protein [Ktedonobacteraceae bacterium]